MIDGAIAQVVAELPTFQRKVVLLVAERLLEGVRRYGSRFQTERNLRREASEELLDAVIYLAVDALATEEVVGR